MTDMSMNEALIAAQQEIRFAKQDAKNPHFNSQFASFQSVHHSVIPVLNKHGFSVIFTTIFEGGLFQLLAHLTYRDGSKLVSSFPLPTAFDRPQVLGSALSYGKRYLLMGLAAIHSTADDDDGNAACEQPTAAEKTSAVTEKALAKLTDAISASDIDEANKLVALIKLRESEKAVAKGTAARAVKMFSEAFPSGDA